MLEAIRHVFHVALHRRSEESTLQDELDFHFEQLTREKITMGMDPGSARRAARLELGGAERLKEEVRDQWGMRWLDGLRTDVRFAARNLWNNRNYAALAIVTLGLGIGSNTALFSVIHAAVFKALPFASDSRLVQLRLIDNQTGRGDAGFSVLDLDDLRAGAKTLDGLVELHVMRFILLDREESTAVDTGVVSGEYFDYLGVKPLYGRVLSPTDERPEANAVLVLSHRYFQSSFGGDPSVVGKTVRMNDRVHTIVGVLPPLPDYPQKADVYMPTTSCPTRSSHNFRANREARMMSAFGRLKAGSTIEQAQEEMTALSRRMRTLDPSAYPKHEDWGVQVLPLKEEMAKRAKPAFTMLFAATALVVLIACANIANLTIARMMQRHRELAIRSSLGATRGRLLQQLAVEGLMVGAAAGLFALLLAGQTLSLLAPFARRLSSRWEEIQLDHTTQLFCAGLAVLAALLGYLLPAQPALRNLIAGAREASPGLTASVAQMRARGLLVSVQVALSFLLLAGAGLLLRSFVQLISTDSGVDTERVLSMEISPNWTKIDDQLKFGELMQTLVEKVRQSPGVMSAGIGLKVPLNQSTPLLRNLLVEGQNGSPSPMVDVATISPGYVETLQVPLLSGRRFQDSDRADSKPVALVNASAARRLWPGGNPVGRRISIDKGETWMTVTGVLSDIRQYGLDREAPDQVYIPFAQFPAGTNVVIRTAVDPRTMARQIKEVLYKIDPEHAVTAMRTLEEIRSESVAPQRTITVLIGLFSLLTLAIMVAGVGGVAALSVVQRKAEIGIRLALGARSGQIVAMVLRQHLRMIVCGVAAGVVASLTLGSMMSAFLYRIRPTDLMTLVLSCVLVLAVGTLACWLPARRAAMVDRLRTD